MIQLLDKNCYQGFTEKFIYMMDHIDANCVKGKHLKIALWFNHRDIAIALVKHTHWFRLLRSTYPGRNGILTTPFREMIRKMPDVAELVLDRCIVSDPHCTNPGDMQYTVIVNYEFMEDLSRPKAKPQEEEIELQMLSSPTGDIPEFHGHDCSYKSLEEVSNKPFFTEWGPVSFSIANHPLSIMAKHGRDNLLSHPVTRSLFQLKWDQFGSVYYINVLTFMLFLVILNLYALLLESPISDTCIAVHSNSTNQQNNTINCDINEPRSLFLFVAAFVILLASVTRLTFDVAAIVQIRRFAALKYAIRLCFYSTSFLFALVFHVDCQCIALWQWQCGVIAVFLSWINLIILLSKFIFTGIYVIMLIQVFYTFLKVLALTFLLIIAFGLPFFMAFNEPSIMRSPFSTPARSLLKVVTMTVGEFEFDGIFRQSPNGDSSTEEEIPFEAVSYILWIIFIVVMPVLLTNMLVGLAVGDIERIQQAASVEKRELLINQVLAVEEALRRRPLRKLRTLGWIKMYPNSPITSLPVSQVLASTKARQYLWRLHCSVGLAVWGREEYDSLKSISSILSRTGMLTNSLEQCCRMKLSQEKSKLTTKLFTQAEEATDLILEVQRELKIQKEELASMKKELKEELVMEMKKEFKSLLDSLAQIKMGSQSVTSVNLPPPLQ